MSYNPLIGRLRSGNLIEAHPQRLENKKTGRWACGRYVKRSLPDHRYDGVEVWTLKYRDSNGKVVVADTGRDKATAEEWVK